MKYRALLVVLGILAAIFSFAYWVWPTPWQTYSSFDGFTGSILTTDGQTHTSRFAAGTYRLNRFTGEAQVKTRVNGKNIWERVRPL